MIGPSGLQEGYDNRVMFLGGSADHQIRRVDIDEDGMPVNDTIMITPRPWIAPLLQGNPRPPQERPAETYIRHRCVSGVHVWWLFALAGYAPPVVDVLDANPTVRT